MKSEGVLLRKAAISYFMTSQIFELAVVLLHYILYVDSPVLFRRHCFMTGTNQIVEPENILKIHILRYLSNIRQKLI